MFRNSNDRWGTLFNELKDKDCEIDRLHQEIDRLHHEIKKINNSEAALLVNKQLETELEEILKENNDLHQDIVSQKNLISDL